MTKFKYCKIYYGIQENLVDQTYYCLNKLLKNNKIIIPAGDEYRSNIFGDHIFGTLKKIFIFIELDDGRFKIKEYSYSYRIQIDIIEKTIETSEDVNVENKINHLHSTLKLNYGDFKNELPEQKMAVTYLKGDEKVLEIGGNIGRNSLIISSILNDDKNLVVLETDENIAKQLTENRDMNMKNFYIENSALSKRKLIQKEWLTYPSDVLFEGYSWVKTINLVELKNKYRIDFDTLVLDCEGAFYYILLDMPEILTNIKLIIMENDYHDIEHKKKVDEILEKNNFYRDYVEAGGWDPCYINFFEVWKK